MASTKRDKMYKYIKFHIEKEGRPPTYDEIRIEMNFQHIGSVEHHLKKLEDEKRITRKDGVHRSIKLIDQESNIPASDTPASDIPVSDTPTSGIPVKGIIAAGEPIDIYSDSSPGEMLEINMELIIGPGNFYALTVSGDSMIEDHICDGDYVLIKEQSSCDDGDIVVAIHKEKNSIVSSTLKRFKKDMNYKKLGLEPSNDKYKTIKIDGEEWEIQGKVVAVFRTTGIHSRSNARPHYRRPKE